MEKLQIGIEISIGEDTDPEQVRDYVERVLTDGMRWDLIPTTVQILSEHDCNHDDSDDETDATDQ